MAHELTLDEIAKFQQDYQQNKQNKIAELAVVNNGVQKQVSTVKVSVI